jgi:hypothetical protein
MRARQWVRLGKLEMVPGPTEVCLLWTMLILLSGNIFLVSERQVNGDSHPTVSLSISSGYACSIQWATLIGFRFALTLIRLD